MQLLCNRQHVVSDSLIFFPFFVFSWKNGMKSWSEMVEMRNALNDVASAGNV